MDSAKRPYYILPVIVFSQFSGTSLWFAGNAILPDIQDDWGLSNAVAGWTSSSVQLGFIAGTFLFALLSIADRFPAKNVFFLSALIGSIANVLLVVAPHSLSSILVLRFLTGFFIAGIYPVGMKLAASWYTKGLGKALGYLVGALVLGTAFPHILRGFQTINWIFILIFISMLASFGGLLIFFLVSEGPNTKEGKSFKLGDLVNVFKVNKFRKASFGYFGHMWELYAFWTFIPLIIHEYDLVKNLNLNTSLLTFLIMSMGTLGCISGGIIATKSGSARVAFATLLVSGTCCLLLPLVFQLNPWIFIPFMLFWGFAVVADSPQLSTLNAQTVDPALVGTGLTIVISIGFLISVGSIELLNFARGFIPIQYMFWLLIPGPVLGLLAISSFLKNQTTSS